MKRLIFQINDGNQNAALAERSNIFSGAITPNSPASTGSKDHGVIFTFNKKFGTTVIEPEGNTAIAISELTPEILLETIIENTDLPDAEKDRFFHVIGGYFIDIQGPRSNRVVTTSQVFGVALEPRFGITEGGKTILVDNWKLLDDRRSPDDMDERKKGPKTEIGWTLIVEEAKTPRSKYPLSGEPIRMIQECADIVNLTSEKTGETDTSITYKFTATIDGPEPKEFIWNLGDGSSPVNNGKTLEHTYQKSASASTLKVSLQTVGVGKCGSTSEVEIPIPPITVKPCPVVTQVDAIQSNLTDTSLKYNFTVQMSGGVATSYDWDFGDGNTKTTKNPRATHTYARPSDADKNFQVRVNTTGPDNCTGAGETEVPVPVQCPTLGLINENLKVLSEDKAKYEFEVVFTGVKPTTFHWDFGDGTTADIPRAKVEHTYDRPSNSKQKFTVIVTSEGPTDECSGNTQIEIEIPAKCPIVNPVLLVVSPEPDPTSDTHTVTFATEFTGPKPDVFNWDFGDGNTTQTNTAQTTHTYPKPGDLQQGTFQVKVETVGPEECRGVARGEVSIPPPCPIFDEIITTQISSNETETVFEFRIPLTSGSQPSKFVWNFGDGSAPVETNKASIRHTYTRSIDSFDQFSITVDTSGPLNCTGRAETNVVVNPPCPEITRISASGVLTNPNPTEITFRFETHFTGIKPELFSWEFGDGSVEQTTSPVVQHTYPRPTLENAQNLVVRVNTSGPENCQGTAQVDISIDPPCPEMSALDSQISALSDTEAHFDFRIQVDGNLPTAYTWDFGDGNTQKTNVPETSHTFARSVNGDQTFIVKVLTQGPQDCRGNAQTDVLIPVQCPQISSISAVPESVVGNTQTFIFTAQVVGKIPNVFHWNFGDGNSANSNSPTIKHTYALPEEVEEEFVINLTTEGPSTCTGEATTKVKVKPSCPVILEIQHISGDPIGDTQSYKFTPMIKGPKPDAFEWDFGDGTTSTSQGVVEHVFTRPQGADTSAEIILTISGPENCRDQKKIRVPLEGICPQILEIQKEPIELSETQFVVEFVANIQGASPDTFVWDFGDGTGTQTTTENKITHTYERPDGNSQSFTVSLSISGPGQRCSDTKEVSCHVPGECPVVVDILKIKERLTETSLELELKAIISPAGTHPDVFKWNFGDGSPVVETTIPSITHTYQRTESDIQAIIVLETEGPVPGNDVPACASRIQINCPIPGIPCPVVVGILAERGVATSAIQPYTFTADIRGTLEPSLYKWDFGDGSPIQESTSKTVKHNYNRPAGNQQEFIVKLDTEGNVDHCQASVNTKIEVGGVCPQIADMTMLEELSDDKLKVTLTPIVDGPSPDGYNVDWGDGKFRTQVLEQPPFVNEYDRKPGKADTYTIKVQGSGPGNCHTNWEGDVEVPPVCPTILKVTQSVSKLTEFVYGVRFEVFWEGPRPELFILSFGQMTTPILSKDPIIFQNFNRVSGRDISMKGKVTLKGPESCNTEVEVKYLFQTCPIFKELTHERISSTKDEQSFKFVVKTEGFPPEKYQWDFGDGKGIKESKSATYTYTYDRPSGSPKSYVVKVSGVGPKDCLAEAETEVNIDPKCPELTAITAKVQPPTETSIEALFTALVGEPKPDKFHWDFGDGSPVEQTTVPTVKHIFQRPIGAEVVYTIKVQAEGPADCISTAELPCPIPGRCPEITEIQIQMDPPMPKTQKVQVSASVKDIMPDQFIWNFGDGSGNKITQAPQTEHTYQRPIGEVEKYKISVQGTGPDACGSSADDGVVIEAICPEITGISTKVKPPTETQLEVIFTALVADPKPLEYTWDFGDNSGIKKTSSPTIAHVYTRPAGDAETLTVTVTGKGPKSCESSVEITCPIPGVCPVISEMDLQTELKPDSFSVILTPTISGPSPDGYSVDWGDGTPKTQTLTSPPFTHTYERPVGDALKQNIKVKAMGPDSCEGDWEGEIEIPGLCPQIINIKQEVVKETDFIYGIKFTVFFEGPKPDMIVLSFGMKTTPIILTGAKVLNGAEFFQNFDRYGGIDYTLNGKVSIQGPKGCKDEQEVEVSVPGSCPRITNLQKEIQDTSREVQNIKFTAVLEGYPPEKYLWDFGDGTPPIESHGSVNSYVHGYERAAGEDKTFVITVSAVGPKDCRADQKTEVEIPGICPAINTFKKVDEILTESYKRVSYELSFVDILPSSYEWDWGDGSSKEITQVPRASHDYPILPGDTKPYTVQVSAIGPGSCISADTDPVEVPGVCPKILSVSPVLESKVGDQQKVKVSLITEGPKADTYVWIFGDGSPEVITTVPEAEHMYAILPGDDKTYRILVDGQGPENCQTSCGGEVEIPGVCPVLKNIDLTYSVPSKDTQEIEVKAIIEGPSPEEYRWTWGDGTEEITSIPTATHSYQRLPGDKKLYFVELALTGPESCGCENGKEVEVPGICPEIQELILSKDEPTATETTVHAEAKIEGPAPDTYIWDWGDGKTQETRTNKASHVYQRPVGEPITYEVSVSIAGPESCACSEKEEVEIEEVCPEITGSDIDYLIKQGYSEGQSSS